MERWSDQRARQKELAGKTYSAELVPKIQELLEEQGVGLQELEAVVVVHGPGSFTGVRIGVSSAKALAEALNIPLLAVSRLAVLAQRPRRRRPFLMPGAASSTLNKLRRGLADAGRDPRTCPGAPGCLRG